VSSAKSTEEARKKNGPTGEKQHSPSWGCDLDEGRGADRDRGILLRDSTESQKDRGRAGGSRGESSMEPYLSKKLKLGSGYRRSAQGKRTKKRRRTHAGELGSLSEMGERGGKDSVRR